MRNVIFFVTGLENGGLENYLLRFIKDRHTHFGKIIVFCKGNFGGYLEEEYRKINNVEIILKKLSYFNFLGYFDLYLFLRKHKDYTICDFTGTFSGLVMLVASYANIKNRIVFYRESEYQFKLSSIKRVYVRILERLVLKFALNILSNSEYAFQNIFSLNVVDNKKFSIIRNGLDVKSFLDIKDNLKKELNISEEMYIVGHIGRYTNAKNHKTIILTAIELCKNREDVVFLFCGNGVRDNLQVLIPIQYKHRFFLFNNRADIPCVLNTIDLFYFPSLNEGQPNSLIEAMIMGKRIVASNIPTIKECVPEAFCNYLIDPYSVRDAVNSIDFFLKETVSIDLQEWSISMFDCSVRFDEFEEVLKF